MTKIEFFLFVLIAACNAHWSIASELRRMFSIEWAEIERVEQDSENNIELLQSKAEQGDAEAQFILGSMYEYGWDVEVEKNFQEAAKWYKLAAAQGYALARLDIPPQHYVENPQEKYTWTADQCNFTISEVKVISKNHFGKPYPTG